jgi:LPXTG-motif cell wall-anchored protein
VGPDGALRYEPEAGYAGHDVFGVTVCDDGRPPLCSSALVRVDVYPEAVDDRATTPQETAVTIDVVDNDSGRHVAPAVVDGPASGTVEVSGDQLVYTPDDGFTGTDRFDYRLCTPGPDPLCRTATVTVTVVPDDQGGDNGHDGNGNGNGSDDGSDDGSDGPSGSLPDTGGPAFWLGAMGALMVAGGGTVLMAARRRRTGATPPHA